ncbi:uncharacterized protein LOC124170692 isoform X2 [Ischnura elegans]|uniref:uncharacterized protein LOC124170692 isoform X2 n=1 Tax=Ischnura elegans TaxID=197161 RepID=UPI001ED8A820|nr:uncharacterized protein LOC124170692 isoform X2 [Ischnura elegans]
MASGPSRISTVGLLPQEGEDDEEDAAETLGELGASAAAGTSRQEPEPGVAGSSNAGFEPGSVVLGESSANQEKRLDVMSEECPVKGEKQSNESAAADKTSERERDSRKGEKEDSASGGGRSERVCEEKARKHREEKSQEIEPRSCASGECSVRICAAEGSECKAKEPRQGSTGRPVDGGGRGVSSGVVLSVSNIAGASGARALESPRRRALESPHRRRVTGGTSTALRRRRVEDSRGAASNAVSAWGSDGVQPDGTVVPAVATTSAPQATGAASGPRVPSNSAPGPSRPPRRSSGPRCQEALSSILWEPYDCRRRRPSLLAADGFRMQALPPTSTFYYHTTFSHPLEDYAFWLPPPPYEAATALPLDGPPPNLPDFFPIAFSSCSSASSSAASSLSTSPSSSSSFLCCSSANANNANRLSLDVATARRAVEKAERAAEEASEAALRRARSFQCLPPEGGCAAEADPSRLPLAATGESGPRRATDQAAGAASARGGGEAAGGRKSGALVADLGGGEESWCPYCLHRPPQEALGSRTTGHRGRCRCKAAVECVSSSRWVGSARKEECSKRKSCAHSRCEGRGCPRRSRAGRTPAAAEMVSVAVEGVRAEVPSAATASRPPPPDEEAPRGGAGAVQASVGSGSETAAEGGDASGAVVGGVVKVVSCRAAAPDTLRVPVPGAAHRAVSNVRISSDAARGSGGGGEAGRTFTSTEAQTDETGGVENRPPGAGEGPQLQEGREQRRRERRERRQHRRSAVGAGVQPLPPPPPPQAPPQLLHPADWQTRLDAIPCGVGAMGAGERLLPDLLNSHLPPPYSTLPMPPAPPPRLIPMVGGPPPPPPNGPPMMPPPPPPPPGSPPQMGAGMRFPFPTPPGRRCRGGGGGGRGGGGGAGVVPLGAAVVPGATGGSGGGGGGGGTHYASDEDGPPKSCCGLSAAGVGGAGQPASVRWFVLAIAFVGVCCALVGTVLGALKATGREHLTVSLLMIGVGIVLITVSGVAWRLTSHDAPSCRMMLGLGGSDEGAAPNRRFVPRLPPSYGRPHHPYAAMMYPEFQYRPPPPSYQASMQEYRLRLLLLDRHPGGNGSVPGGAVGAGPMPPITAPPHPAPPLLAPNQPHPHHLHAISPPPTYRSYAGSTIREWRCRAGLGLRRGAVDPQDHSRPPSYRSRASSSTRPTLDPAGGPNGSVGQHSRDASLSLSYLSANSHDTDPDIRVGGGGGGIVNPCDVSVINVDSSSLPSSPLPDNLVLMMVTTGGGGDADVEEKKLAMGEGEGVEVVVDGDGGTLLHRLCGGGDRKHPGPATVVLEDTHLVTIVQTSDATVENHGMSRTTESVVSNQQQQSQQQQQNQLQQQQNQLQHSVGQGEAVIVTVSGLTPSAPQNVSEGGEMEILAHL